VERPSRGWFAVGDALAGRADAVEWILPTRSSQDSIMSNHDGRRRFGILLLNNVIVVLLLNLLVVVASFQYFNL
jgi:hypothetical protein